MGLGCEWGSEEEELDSAEELSELDELDSAEELSELDELDELEELEELSELDELEELSELEGLAEPEPPGGVTVQAPHNREKIAKPAIANGNFFMWVAS